jgi:hypothetical protein
MTTTDYIIAIAIGVTLNLTMLVMFLREERR